MKWWSLFLSYMVCFSELNVQSNIEFHTVAKPSNAGNFSLALRRKVCDVKVFIRWVIWRGAEWKRTRARGRQSEVRQKGHQNNSGTWKLTAKCVTQTAHSIITNTVNTKITQRSAYSWHCALTPLTTARAQSTLEEVLLLLWCLLLRKQTFLHKLR